MKFRDTFRSVTSIYAHSRGLHVQLKYRKNIYFLFPEKAIFNNEIGMTDTFFALYWCLCINISFIIPYSDSVCHWPFFPKTLYVTDNSKDG